MKSVSPSGTPFLLLPCSPSSHHLFSAFPVRRGRFSLCAETSSEFALLRTCRTSQLRHSLVFFFSFQHDVFVFLGANHCIISPFLCFRHSCHYFNLELTLSCIKLLWRCSDTEYSPTALRPALSRLPHGWCLGLSLHHMLGLPSPWSHFLHFLPLLS